MKLGKNQGFSLIELLIALAIVGIVASFAMYSYTSYVMRGRRLDGINALLSLSMAQEKYRNTNPSYGTLTQVWNNGTLSPAGNYTLSMTNITASGYTATATAVGSQANDAQSGVSCANLSLTASNASITKQPSACWPN
jgi:type IV pilus assembly protein PilE